MQALSHAVVLLARGTELMKMPVTSADGKARKGLLGSSRNEYLVVKFIRLSQKCSATLYKKKEVQQKDMKRTRCHVKTMSGQVGHKSRVSGVLASI